jgi:DNA-binding transcriptional LysR family regulator
MKIQHIEVLVAIAEAGSIRGAAAMLGKSQPGLTKALRLAEDDLGMPLFQRTSHGVLLTETGEKVLVRARTIMAEISRLDDEVAQLRGQQVGSVNVCVSPLAAAQIMPRAVALFRKTHPKIGVHISSGLFPGALKPLREGRFDLLVGPKPPREQDREILADPLLMTPVVVVAAKDSPLSRATSLAELAEADWIMIGEKSGPGNVFKEAFQNAGLTPPSPITTSESYVGALALVESAGSVCTFPLLLLKSVQRDWRITAVPIRETIDPLQIALMTRAGHPLTPAADALANCIRRVSNTVKNEGY